MQLATITKRLFPSWTQNAQRAPVSVAAPSRRALHAGFDAASQNSPDNARHWANTDSLSPNAAASDAVRQRLRDRARYEAKNNSYCRGMVTTLANDTIGSGPRLQLRNRLEPTNAKIEEAWRRWAKQVKLAEKLRQIRVAYAIDGEALAITVTNPRLSPATLDLRLLECDYLRSPLGSFRNEDQHVDGVELDEGGNPISYWLLDSHPGGTASTGYDVGSWYPSSRVFHLPCRHRAGQVRGVPEITPALELYAILRRYTLAVLGSAETAADVAGILKTHGPPDSDPQAVDPFLPIDFERRGLLTMPRGWEMQQLRAEQPTTTYPDFKHEVINEIARCLHMPFNVAAGNSSDYNYASGRLDHQLYFRAIDIFRDWVAIEVLDRLFATWIQEYLAVMDRRRPSVIDVDRFPRRWVWDGFHHADPAKEAAATIELWKAGLLSDDEYLLREGVDPEEHYERMGHQRRMREELELPLPGVAEQLIRVDDPGRGSPESRVQSPEPEELQPADAETE